jgi:hypothetical protein
MLKELVDHMPVAEAIFIRLPLPSVLDLCLINHHFFNIISPIISLQCRAEEEDEGEGRRKGEERENKEEGKKR